MNKETILKKIQLNNSLIRIYQDKIEELKSDNEINQLALERLEE